MPHNLCELLLVCLIDFMRALDALSIKFLVVGKEVCALEDLVQIRPGPIFWFFAN